MKFTSSLLATAALALLVGGANAAALNFSSANATFEQNASGNWTAALAIDGDSTSTALPSGWAIFNGSGTDSETALFTLASPLAAGSYSFTYTLYQAFGFTHTLGNFSLGYTTDALPGLASTQTSVSITSAASTNGATLAISGGGVVASGFAPVTDTYTIVANVTSAAPITGLYLNAIDPVGPARPGRQQNGNFVLTEFAVNVTAVPEPHSVALALAAIAGLGAVSRRRKV